MMASMSVDLSHPFGPRMVLRSGWPPPGARSLRPQSSGDPGIVGVPGIQPEVDFDLRLHHHGHPDPGPVENLSAMEAARRDSLHGIRVRTSFPAMRGSAPNR
jgi:hypothetical protein